MGLTAQAGGGKGGGKNQVDVYNGNSYDDADGDIRVWLITEDQVPATRGEAAELPSQNLPGMVGTSFLNLDDGTYILVAADEGLFSSVSDDTPIAAGTAYSAQVVELEDGQIAQFTVKDDPEGGPPVIEEGISPPSGDQGDDSGMPPGDG